MSEPEVVTITVRISDIRDALSGLGFAHSQYCLSGEACGCAAVDERLSDALTAAGVPDE